MEPAEHDAQSLGIDQFALQPRRVATRTAQRDGQVDGSHAGSGSEADSIHFEDWSYPFCTFRTSRDWSYRG